MTFVEIRSFPSLVKTTQTLVRIQGSVFVAASLWAVSALPAADLVREGEARCLIVTADAPSPAAREGSKRLAAELEALAKNDHLTAASSSVSHLQQLYPAVAEAVQQLRANVAAHGFKVN